MSAPVVPIVTTRDAARRAAADELAKPGYAHAQPTLVRRFLTWIGDKIDHFLASAFGASGGGAASWWALAALLVLLIGVLVLIRWKYGPVRRTTKAAGLLFDESSPLDAAEYRKAAEVFAAAEQWAEAVRARLRAVITGLEERTLLDPRPGRTADVAAREAGIALPDQAAALAEAARIFDDIWYGEAVAHAVDYRRMAEIDQAVADAKPRLTVTAGAGAGIG